MQSLISRRAHVRLSAAMITRRPNRLAARCVRVEGFERRWLLSGASPTPAVNQEFCPADSDEFIQGNIQAMINDGLIDSSGLEAAIQGRWSSTATNASTGTAGNPITLTWGFVADGITIPAGSSGEAAAASNLQASLNALYGSSTTWQPLFQKVFDRWSSLAGLSYVYTGLSDDGAPLPQIFVTSGAPGVLGVRPDIRIGGKALDGVSGTLAYNWFPNVGDMVVDTSDIGLSTGFYSHLANDSRALRNVLGHEHGHGLGFNHSNPINGTKLMEASTSSAPTFDGPQFDDILAAQINYGDPFEKGGRNDTAATASNLGFLGIQVNSAVSAWVDANDPVTPRSIANTSDFDYLKFTVASNTGVSFTLSPFGPTYATDAGTFNASAQGNLALQLIGTDGTTVIQSVDATGLGGSETVTTSALAAGTYYLRVGISSGSTQPYNLSATINAVSNFFPALPAAPDLVASSDSGISNRDNITNDNTPTFTGFADPGSTVKVYFNLVEVGSGVATGGIYNITTSARPDGTYNVVVNVTNANAASAAGPGITVTIDTTAPAAPTGNGIYAPFDTGDSNSDRITRSSLPDLAGTAEPGSAVEILWLDAISFGSGSTSTAGAYLVTLNTSLGDGLWNLTARATDRAGNRSAAANYSITIDTVGPTITSTAFNRDDLQFLLVNYSETLGNGIGSVVLNNLTLGTSFPTIANFSGSTADYYAVAGNALTDGKYNAVWSPNTLTDVAGNPGTATNPVRTFNFLRADFNNNSTVNFDDLLILAANYNQTLAGPKNSKGDANYDGKVNFDDLLILAATYNTSLPPIAGAPAPITAGATGGPNSGPNKGVRFGVGAPPPRSQQDGNGVPADDTTSSVLT
jgi:hypothetical protein